MQNNCSLVVIDTAGGTTSQCLTRQVAVIVKKEFVIATGAGLTRRVIYGITPANSFDNCLSVRTHTSCYVSEAATTRSSPANGMVIALFMWVSGRHTFCKQ